MGTQTSKPLFGDEERRNRFRRPRTPTNITSSSTASTTSSSADATTTTTTRGGGENNSGNNNNKRTTWPCANCHATVSNEESRCPYCGGIQVKVKIPRSPLSATKGSINANLLLERLMTTPTTPVNRKEIDPSKIQAFLSESATTSTMDYDDEEEEEEDDEEVMLQQQQQQQEKINNNKSNRLVVVTDKNNNDGNINNRPASALSQGSSLSQNFNIPIQQVHQQHPPVPPFDNSSPIPPFFSDRPPDPVAFTLESAQVRSGAPSPAAPQVVIFDNSTVNNDATPSPIPMVSRQQQQQQQPITNPFVVTKRKAAASCSSGFEVPKKKVAAVAASSSSS